MVERIPTTDTIVVSERADALEDGRAIGRSADELALLASWLHGRSDHTRRAYSANVARFLTVVEKPLAQVTLADLQDYADTLGAAGLAPASRARMLAAVKSLLTFAHTTGFIPYNPGRGLRLPGVRGRLAERIPSEEDVLTLLAGERNRRNHAFIRLLYNAGLRLSEACALCWRDLQGRGDAGQVTVWGKGEKERTILLSAGTWRELLALRPTGAGPDDPVFRSRHGRPLSPTQAWRIVKAAAAPGPSCRRSWGMGPPRTGAGGSGRPRACGRASRRSWGLPARAAAGIERLFIVHRCRPVVPRLPHRAIPEQPGDGAPTR
jgi:site-specific recombinase XerD